MFETAPKRLIGIVVALLVTSGVYLAIVRGSALLLDLSALVGMICF